MFLLRGSTNNHTARLRWTRFSLRTMFVLTTVIACWLGWELSIVRQRRELRRTLEEQAGYEFASADLRLVPDPSLSWLRQLLGDQAINTIQLPWFYDKNAPEFAELSHVFPEATLLGPNYGSSTSPRFFRPRQIPAASPK